MSREDGSALGDAMRIESMKPGELTGSSIMANMRRHEVLASEDIRQRQQRAKTNFRLSTGARKSYWGYMSMMRAMVRSANFYQLARAHAGLGSPQDVEVALRRRLPALDITVNRRKFEGMAPLEVVFRRGDRLFVALTQTSELRDVNALTMRVIKMAYGPEFAAGPQGA